MSTIEAILAGSERVKGCTSKTKWKQSSLPSPVILHNSDHTYFTEKFFTLASYIQYSKRVCSLALNKPHPQIGRAH